MPQTMVVKSLNLSSMELPSGKEPRTRGEPPREGQKPASKYHHMSQKRVVKSLYLTYIKLLRSSVGLRNWNAPLRGRVPNRVRTQSHVKEGIRKTRHLRSLELLPSGIKPKPRGAPLREEAQTPLSENGRGRCRRASNDHRRLLACSRRPAAHSFSTGLSLQTSPDTVTCHKL